MVPIEIPATRTAWFASAIAFSGVIGNPVSGIAMDTLSGRMGLDGWQWLFLIEGIPSVIVGVWVIYFLDSNIREAKWLNSEEKEFLIANLEAEDRRKHQVRVADAFKSWKVYVLSLIYFTLVIGLYGIAFWLPSMVNAFGVKDYLDVGLITAIPYGVAVLGMILLSRSSDRTGERRWHYALNVTMGCIGLILSGIFLASPVLSVVFLSVATAGVIGSIPLFWPIPSAFLAGTAAAAGIGIVNSIGNLGGYIGPNVTIWMKAFPQIHPPHFTALRA